jgi:hypothetical protein
MTLSGCANLQFTFLEVTLMKRLAVCLTLLVALTTTTGCWSRVIKESAGAALGAKGMAKPLGTTAASGTSLAGYTRYAVEPFGSAATAPNVPAEVQANLGDEVAKQLAAKKIMNDPSGKTLTIRGTFIYYEGSSAATSHLFGPFEEVIAMVQFIDGNRLVGEAVCVGRSTESVNVGASKKTQGLAKGIVDWIEKNGAPKIQAEKN